jgi:hypothetical protein
MIYLDNPIQCFFIVKPIQRGVQKDIQREKSERPAWEIYDETGICPLYGSHRIKYNEATVRIKQGVLHNFPLGPMYICHLHISLVNFVVKNVD